MVEIQFWKWYGTGKMERSKNGGERNILRRALFLNEEAVKKLTDLVGNNFENWKSFAALKQIGEVWVGWQIRVVQNSPRETNRCNSMVKGRADISSLFQLSPNARFSIKAYECLPDGVHYLYSSIQIDAVGRVLDLHRMWTKQKVDLAPQDEQPAVLYSNDPFKNKLWANLPIKRVSPHIEQEMLAESRIENLSKILRERNFEFLPLDDSKNVTGLDRSHYRVSGWSVT